MGLSSRGLFGFLARLGRPPAADSDADLLDRFVRSADEAAFTEVVRRHGRMVLAVCRRRLGRDADAEDAFQAVFLALAKSAAAIGRRESLPGWLYRVAYLVSLKAAGRRARHPAVALPAAELPMPDPPTHSCETDELKAVLDAELAGLPDRFRAVVVLCLIEGRTNAEAAAVLGVPIGTVDSRLNTARKKLQAALTRRGVAVGAGLSLGQVLGGSLSAEGPAFSDLVSHTVRAVLAEAAGPGTGAVTPAVAELARGVATMTTNLRFLAALGVALGLLGGAGAGIYFATAADEPPKPGAAAAEPQQPPGDKPPAENTTRPEQKPKGNPNDVVGAEALNVPFGLVVPEDGIPLGELLHRIEARTELVVRVDVAAFKRVGVPGVNLEGSEDLRLFLRMFYDTKAVLPRKADKLPNAVVLADALAQVPINYPCTYQVRGEQLVIIPAYVPPLRPGNNPLDPADEEPAVIDQRALNEQIYGGVVRVLADRRPLPEILADLRKQTGANIVLDPRAEEQAKKTPLSIVLSDVRLYDALRVIADMSELKMVYAGNIYYITTAANAKQFQPPTQRPQYGGIGPGIGGGFGGPPVGGTPPPGGGKE
jgi:RNA polymerase sigma factor (sigma-70 family)